MQTNAKKPDVPSGTRMTAERVMLAENTQQGAVLGARTRTGSSRDHHRSILDDPDPNFQSTGAPLYHPDSDDGPLEPQGAQGFTRLDCYIESPYIGNRNPASGSDSDIYLEKTLQNLQVSVEVFATRFDERHNWEARLWSTEEQIKREIDSVLGFARKLDRKDSIELALDLEARFKIASAKWNRKLEDSYDPESSEVSLLSFQVPSTDGTIVEGFQNSTLISNLAQDVSISSLPQLTVIQSNHPIPTPRKSLSFRLSNVTQTQAVTESASLSQSHSAGSQTYPTNVTQTQAVLESASLMGKVTVSIEGHPANPDIAVEEQTLSYSPQPQEILDTPAGRDDPDLDNQNDVTVDKFTHRHTGPYHNPKMRKRSLKDEIIEADTRVPRSAHYLQNDFPDNEAPPHSERLENPDDCEESDPDESESESNIDLSVYDRSRGDIPTFKCIIEDIRENRPEIYERLTRNEKTLIKKCSQLEEKLLDIDQSQKNVNFVNQSLLSSTDNNRKGLKDTAAAMAALEFKADSLYKDLAAKLAGQENRVSKQNDNLISLSNQISSQSRTINQILEEKNGIVPGLAEVQNLLSTLQTQFIELERKTTVTEDQNRILTVKLAHLSKLYDSCHSDQHGQSQPSFGNPHVHGINPASSGIVLTSTTTNLIVTQPTTTTSDPSNPRSISPIPINGIRRNGSINMPSVSAGAASQLGQRTVVDPPPSQHAFDQVANPPLLRGALPFSNSSVLMNNQAAAGDEMSQAIFAHSQQNPYNHQATTPSHSHHASLLRSGPVSPDHIDSETLISRELLRESFLMLVDKLEGMIVREIDESAPQEKIHEYDTSLIPRIEKVSKQCNEACMTYSAYPGRDAILCQRAIRVMREASRWIRNVRSLAESRESYSKPLGKEFKDDLKVFSNDAKQNVFEFFKRFEDLFQQKGTEKQRGEILVSRYLAPRIALQVTEFNEDYQKIKAFLTKRYGDVLTLTNAIIEDLESIKKPSTGTSFRLVSVYFTTVLSGIYKVKNLSNITGIDVDELSSHINSRSFLDRLVELLPDSYRVEFNNAAHDKGFDPQKLSGSDAMDLIIHFINRVIVSLDSFTKDASKKPTVPAKEKTVKKSPSRAANLVSKSRKSTSYSTSSEDESDGGSVVHTVASANPSKPKAHKPKWYADGLKFPCPMESHSHEIGTCNEFLSLTPKKRMEISSRKLCFTCMGPWTKCPKKCSQVKNIPKELICRECKGKAIKLKKSPFNILVCSRDDHSKPLYKDIVKSFKSWFPDFNVKNDVKLSANVLIASFMPSCHKCGQEDVCACNMPTKSSLVDPYAKVPIIDTETGNDIIVSDEDIIREVNEATCFVMQWLMIRGKEFLTFYDRGASQHLINGKMAEETNLKVINSRPSSLNVVGGGSVSTEYGLYRLGLGRTQEGKVHDIVCQGISSITSVFPKYDLQEINEELWNMEPKPAIPQEAMPLEIGGSEVHLLLGLKDTELEPKLLFSLPNGLGVYRSKLKDKFGSTLCYGGPHPVFTRVHRLSNGRVNHFMAMFVNSYRNSIYSILSDSEERFENEYEHNGFGVYIHKEQGQVYSIDTDSELCCKVFPTPLCEDDFIESNCIVPDDPFENYDKVLPNNFLDREADRISKASKSELDERGVVPSHHLCSDLQSAEWTIPQHFHYCPVMKAKVPLSRLKEMIDQSDTNDTVTYRCPECAKCIKCKESSKTKAISLKEKIEQTFIDKSVFVDLEKKKVFVDMPFVKDPVHFLTERHKGPNNRSQALSVYRTQCRKPLSIKDGIRDVHRGLVEKGFMVKLESLTADQQKIVREAKFQHFFPWRCVYKEDSISTPVRMVVDPTMSGLNLILAKGENRLGKVTDIMIKTRSTKYTWTSDISKLYNQLKLNDGSLPYSLFLYDESLDPEIAPSVWVMTSAWYGAGSSGGQAENALEKLARVDPEKYPEAVKTLTEDRYVDDISSGADTMEARELQIEQTREVLQFGGLSMKFVVRSGEPPSPDASADGVSLKLLGHRWEPVSDYFSPGFSELNFNRRVRGVKKSNPSPVVTKADAESLMKGLVVTRQVVASKMAEFYDPIGLWEPFKLQLKLEVSKLNGLDWKEPLPDETQELWKQIFLQFTEFSAMTVTRCTIPPELPGGSQVRLLCISDAAVHAGGAAVYANYRLDNGKYSCTLLTSKSRLLDGTVPRNELSAILLMAELAYTIKKSLGSIVGQILYVTDSTIAMCWTFNTQKKLRLYALNRVTLIRQMIEWTTGETENLPLYHIDGTLNPADLLTKPHDIGPTDLMMDSTWQCGMDWMRLPFEEMPLKSYSDLKFDAKSQKEIDAECFQEPFLPSVDSQVHGLFDPKPWTSSTVSHCTGCITVQPDRLSAFCYGRVDDLDHCNCCTCPDVFSSVPKAGRGADYLLVDVIHFGWKKAINILARVYRIHNTIIHRAHSNAKDAERQVKWKSMCKLCNTSEENLSNVLAIEAELKFFRDDCKVTKSRIPSRKLKEFQQDDGIIWYTGRLSELNSVKTRDLDLDSFFDNTEIKSVLPVLTSDSPVFYAYVMYIHFKVRPHSGVEVTMREVSKKMHVINNPRRVIQQVRNDCTRCRLILKKTMELEMAQHHEARTTLAPPFYNCMADIAYGFKGKPYYGARKECKVYALVIVCVLTSATNILALEGLQTQNVIQALERHSSRYGVPNRIFVDNGTQLVSLQNNEFSLRDVHLQVYDSMGMSVEVSSAKSHESRGRVEAKVKILRSMLNKLAINTDSPMTALQWETCFSRISNQIDDLPMAKGKSTNLSDIGWEIITPNRLKLGRNNFRSLTGPISLTGGSGWDNLLEINRTAQVTWYQMLLDRLHQLILKPNKWLKSDSANVDDIVLFVYLDSLRSKDQAVWKIGKIISINPSGRKVTIAFPDKTSPGKIPKLRTISRSIREISIIYSVNDFPVNTHEHFDSISN